MRFVISIESAVISPSDFFLASESSTCFGTLNFVNVLQMTVVNADLFEGDK